MKATLAAASLLFAMAYCNQRDDLINNCIKFEGSIENEDKTFLSSNKEQGSSGTYAYFKFDNEYGLDMSSNNHHLKFNQQVLLQLVPSF